MQITAVTLITLMYTLIYQQENNVVSENFTASHLVSVGSCKHRGGEVGHISALWTRHIFSITCKDRRTNH